MKPMFSIIGWISLSISIVSTTAYAEAGKVFFVDGLVSVSKDGKDRRLFKNDQIDEGDLIKTNNRSSAQIRMSDGGLLAVRPGTNLKIASYSYQEKEKQDRSFFSLLKGSFRSITGFIGLNDKKAFRVSTPTATVGIRGSDADIGYRASDGLTGVRTFTGGHTLTGNDQNGQPFTINTGPGQIGIHVPGTAPQYADSFPFETPAPRSDGKRPAGDKDKQAGEISQGDTPPNQQQTAGTNQQQTQPIAQQTTEPAPVFDKTVGDNTSLNFVTEAPVGSGLIGSDMRRENGRIETGNGGLVIDGSGDQTVNLNDKNQVISVVDNSQGDSFNFIAGDATLARSDSWEIQKVSEDAFGQVTRSGTAASGNWGVWIGDYKVIDRGSERQTLSGFHGVISDDVTSVSEIKQLDGINFTYVKQTGAITNEAGAFASKYDMKAHGAFRNDSTLGSVTLEMRASGFTTGSDGWEAKYNGDVATLIGESGMGGLDLQQARCNSCSSQMHGSSSGRFVGSRADGLIVGVGISDGTNAVNGAAVLQR